ncbi:Dos2-interacting transcription regulator of RNA-Pol-II-domain-containing protein [Colletotrichum godetiae]|uniref:MMS19 nucleotide excision repair protein n=1 Tax=Colletotrichum godetiae TaxID=1209918 RepID=A0AAJ0AQ93_9PEZI|nr:Dos2-interacting transcription regulator of RNA-Pol-II-domain-containing protein [Colletotrichum godetiae]KAK1688383.1 Dos2-interacting transcription regulator of RNA-Pol-II-domain-containing protein [Colletotrichum godetiae]
MADFRKLALEFVLSDDSERQTAITQEAASEIQSAPRPSNPVARWVESIRPWMPSANEDQDDGDGDVIARSKALSFLAGTLEHLDPAFLKADQTNLLVAFFGSMFKVDHKAGIMPAAKALDRTASMKTFQPQKGNDIIQSVCSLGDDFKSQVAETRGTVYELLDHLITNPDVANDLQYQHGTTSGFITDLLQLCRNERDPKCLMTWFKILKVFLSDYSPAQEVVDEIFSIFSAYFPISLRTSQHPSGITADDLKLALRACFSAHHRVASKAIPYLLGRLDQPDSVSVNVKVDILKTMTACLSSYEHVQQGVTPFTDKIWDSLKYEVRNGEIEDTINATLEVIRTVAKRLTGDELRDFALTVQRDCLEDLSNPIYTAASGKLLISIHSAKPAAFALMISPSVTHIKENLRHTKSPDHTKNLLILLNSLLELRLALTGGDVELSAEDAEAFKSTEPLLAPIYKQTYLPLFQKALQDTAQPEDITIGQQATKGLGLMVCQRAAQSGQSNRPMLPEETLTEICDNLATLALQAPGELAKDKNQLKISDEAAIALQKATMAHPPAQAKLIAICFQVCDAYSTSPSAKTLDSVHDVLKYNLARLTYVFCSQCPRSEKLKLYTSFLEALLVNLHKMMDVKADPKIWSVIATYIFSAMLQFKEAAKEHISHPVKNNFSDKRFDNNWVTYVANRFANLRRRPDDRIDAMELTDESNEVDNLQGDLALINLYVARQLYRRATKIISYANNSELSLALSDDFSRKDPEDKNEEDAYLHHLSSIATFTIQHMSEYQQTNLLLNEEVVTLFRGSDRYTHPNPDENHSWNNSELRMAMLRTMGLPQPPYTLRNPPQFPISGFSHGRTVVLSLGIIQAFHPTTVERLVERGTAHQILVAGLLTRDHSDSPKCRHVVSAILSVIANKYKVENLNDIVQMMETQMNFVVSEERLSDKLERITGYLDHEENVVAGHSVNDLRAALARPVFAIVAGVLRRYTGNALKNVLTAITQGPGNKKIGHMLARSMDFIFTDLNVAKPQLYGQLKKLWVQRAYYELVRPMLPKAWPAGSNSKDDMLVAANYSIAVLRAVKHIRYAHYEDDTEDLIRIILCAIRNLPASADVAAGLHILVVITENSPRRMQPFLKSVIDASLSIFRRGRTHQAGEDNAWMPENYMPFDRSGFQEAQCRALVVRLIGQLPPNFEHRHLLDSASQAKRLLAQASGDESRMVREAALKSRKAWDDVN